MLILIRAVSKILEQLEVFCSEESLSQDIFVCVLIIQETPRRG